MKIKSAVVLSALLCFSGFLFAQNEDPLKFHIVTDVTYSPATDYVPGDTHFAPITGAYSCFGARTTFNTTYRLPTPLGKNFLLSGAHLDLNGHIELVLYLNPHSFIVLKPSNKQGNVTHKKRIQSRSEIFFIVSFIFTISSIFIVG